MVVGMTLAMPRYSIAGNFLGKPRIQNPGFSREAHYLAKGLR